MRALLIATFLSALPFGVFANSITVSGNDIVDVTSAIRDALTLDTSTLNTYAAVDVISARGQSTVNMYSGTDSAFVDLRDFSELNVFDATISFLTLYDSSTVNIHFADLSWLRVIDGVEAHIYGTDFVQSSRRLSGTWANGQSFEFWALNHRGDGSVEPPVPGGVEPIPSSIILHDIALVPIPAAVWLFGSALGLLSWLRRSRNITQG